MRWKKPSWIVTVWVVLLAAAFIPFASAQIGDGLEFGDGFEGLTPAPGVTPNGAQSIGLNLLSGLALFGVLPLALGAGVFLITVKEFSNNGSGDVSGTIIPALFSTVVAVILIEVCLYVAVYVVSGFAV